MNGRLGFSIAVLLMASACATEGVAPPMAGAPPAAATAAFRTSDFAWSTAPGTGRIEGQLSYRPMGKVHSCAAAGVLLTPDTPWVRSRMNILYSSTEKAILPADEVRRRTPPERSQDYSSFVRRTSCDSAGRFSFSGLPDGTWYVITVARPQPAGSGSDIAIMRRVTTKGSKVVNISL